MSYLPPEISSDDLTFSLSLHHRPMYSKEESLWLSQYETISLSAEERGIMLIGRKGDLIAPNDIIRRLGIVDIEHYRKLIESLQRKGLLVNTKSKGQVQASQKREGVGARDVARFRIIPFKDILDTKKTGERSSVDGSDSYSHRVSKKKKIDNKKNAGSPESSFGDNAVYVANIPPNTTQRDVIFAFRDVGSISSVRIPQSNGLSRGFAFIEFEGASTAQAAMAAHISMGGRKLTLRWATPPTRAKP